MGTLAVVSIYIVALVIYSLVCFLTIKLLSKRGCDLSLLIFAELLFCFAFIGCSIISLCYPFTIFVLVSIAVLVGIAFKLFDFIFNLFVKKQIHNNNLKDGYYIIVIFYFNCLFVLIPYLTYRVSRLFILIQVQHLLATQSRRYSAVERASYIHLFLS